MAKNDRRNSRKMKRRRGEASKRRTQARRKALVTEARKNGTKAKKPTPSALPPKVDAASTVTPETETSPTEA